MFIHTTSLLNKSISLSFFLLIFNCKNISNNGKYAMISDGEGSPNTTPNPSNNPLLDLGLTTSSSWECTICFNKVPLDGWCPIACTEAKSGNNHACCLGCIAQLTSTQYLDSTDLLSYSCPTCRSLVSIKDISSNRWIQQFKKAFENLDLAYLKPWINTNDPSSQNHFEAVYKLCKHTLHYPMDSAIIDFIQSNNLTATNIQFIETFLKKVAAISKNEFISIINLTATHMDAKRWEIELKPIFVQTLTATQEINHDLYIANLLYTACKEGYPRVVDVCLRNGAISLHINHRYQNHYTLLHVAAERGHKEVVEKLLTVSNIEVNLINRSGHTPLYLAIKNKHRPTADVLLNSKKIDLTASSRLGNNILHILAQEDSVNLLYLLASGKAPVNLTNKIGCTPLHNAVKAGGQNMVYILLTKHDINANAQCKLGNTPLHLAVIYNNIDILQQLIKSKKVFPSLTMQNNEGKTPLDFASEGQKIAIQAWLTEAGLG